MIEEPGSAAMPGPTIRAIERAICCPPGVCTSPTSCYAMDRSRSYPVQIHEAAEAVVRLLCEQRKAGSELRDGDHPV